MTSLKNRTTEGPQKGTSPEIPANSDLAKYMAEHPDASVHRLRFTYTVTDAGPDGEIVTFDLNGKRYERPAQQRSSVTYEPGTYEPADVSKIPADSDLGKILGEYPDAKVNIHTHKGMRSYTATWGTYPWGGPKFMAEFDMSGHQIQSYQVKSAAFKSGQIKIQDKKLKKEQLASIAKTSTKSYE